MSVLNVPRSIQYTYLVFPHPLAPCSQTRGTRSQDLREPIPYSVESCLPSLNNCLRQQKAVMSLSDLKMTIHSQSIGTSPLFCICRQGQGRNPSRGRLDSPPWCRVCRDALSRDLERPYETTALPFWALAVSAVHREVTILFYDAVHDIRTSSSNGFIISTIRLQVSASSDTSTSVGS